MENRFNRDAIVFDGECNLCNGIVGWLLNNGAADEFEMIAFQSPNGQQILHDYGFPTDRLETVVLMTASGIKTHSDGFYCNSQ